MSLTSGSGAARSRLALDAISPRYAACLDVFVDIQRDLDSPRVGCSARHPGVRAVRQVDECVVHPVASLTDTETHEQLPAVGRKRRLSAYWFGAGPEGACHNSTRSWSA